jgi:TetR/AcrR family transcriptional regulator
MERFEALPEEKRQKILDAAVREFAARGYEKASTNAIVKAAGISKGILFHYFGSKRKLYLYVVEHAFGVVSKAVYQALPDLSGDIVEVVIEAVAVKVRMAAVYPEFYRILLEAYVDTPQELADIMEKEYAGVFDTQRDVLIGMMDKGKLRDDVTPGQAVDFIIACAQGIYTPMLDRRGKPTLEGTLETVEQYREKLKGMLHLIRRAIYKE